MGKRKRTSRAPVDASDNPLLGTTIFFDAEPAEDEAPRGGIGSQVLPVAEAFDDDSHGRLDDGTVYLSMVRKEAAGLRDIVSVATTSLTPPPSATAQRQRPPRPHLERPTDAWRIDFERKFNRLRATIRTAGESPTLPDLSYFPTPDSTDEASWRAYIYGSPKRKTPAKPIRLPPTPPSDAGASADEASALEQLDAATYLPKAPHLAVIRSLDHATVWHVLDFYTGWLQERLDMAQEAPSISFLPLALRRKGAASATAPPAAAAAAAAKASGPPAFEQLDAQWLFAFLATIDELLSGESLDQLRKLARTCLAILAAQPDVVRDADARAGCWLVVAAVSGQWGQRDLWMDT